MASSRVSCQISECRITPPIERTETAKGAVPPLIVRTLGVKNEGDDLRFGIRELSLEDPLIELPEEELGLLRRSRSSFIAHLDIEEKIDLVLENFAEYERELLSLTLRRALFWDLSYSSFISDINLINRRLANLLTTGRLYIDQVQHDVQAVYGVGHSTLQSLKAKLKEEYDSTLGYRVMEALRNHIQHRGLPIHGVNYPNRRDDSSGRRSLKWRIAPYLSVDALREDKDFKKPVLRERQSRGAKVVVTPLVREYVESIGRTHEHLRDLCSKDMAEWTQQLEGLIERGRVVLDENLGGVALVAEDGSGNCIHSEQVFTDLLDRYKFLKNKNLALKHISLHFVSGEYIEGESE